MSKKDYIEYKCRYSGYVERLYGRSDWCPNCGKPHPKFENMGDTFVIAAVGGAFFLIIIISFQLSLGIFF